MGCSWLLGEVGKGVLDVVMLLGERWGLSGFLLGC